MIHFVRPVRVSSVRCPGSARLAVGWPAAATLRRHGRLPAWVHGTRAVRFEGKASRDALEQGVSLNSPNGAASSQAVIHSLHPTYVAHPTVNFQFHVSTMETIDLERLRRGARLASCNTWSMCLATPGTWCQHMQRQLARRGPRCTVGLAATASAFWKQLHAQTPTPTLHRAHTAQPRVIVLYMPLPAPANCDLTHRIKVRARSRVRCCPAARARSWCAKPQRRAIQGHCARATSSPAL